MKVDLNSALLVGLICAIGYSVAGPLGLGLVAIYFLVTK